MLTKEDLKHMMEIINNANGYAGVQVVPENTSKIPLRFRGSFLEIAGRPDYYQLKVTRNAQILCRYLFVQSSGKPKINKELYLDAIKELVGEDSGTPEQRDAYMKALRAAARKINAYLFVLLGEDLISISEKNRVVQFNKNIRHRIS